MQDAVLNLLPRQAADQERLDHVGYLEEYPQYPTGSSLMRSPRRKRRRRRAAGLGTQVQGLGNRPERLHSFTIQEQKLGADLPGDR